MNFITQFILLLLLGVFGGFLLKQFKLPSVIGYIFGGILFTLLFGTQNSVEIIELAEIGVTLLLFAIGMDFSIDRLLAVKKYAVIGGAIQILLTIISSFLIFQLFGFTAYNAIFLGSIFSLSSTAIVAKLLEDNNDTESFAGKITIGWLVVQDIAVVLIVILLSSFAQKEIDPGMIFESIFKSIVLVLLALVVGRKVLPRILTTISKKGGRDFLIIVAFTFAILFSFISEYLGISSTLGAFLAGLMISESVYTHEIITEIKPFQTIFSMLFFVTIGTLFSVEYFFAHLFLILGVLLAGISIKLLISILINYLNRINVKANFLISIFLAQIGEFAFLISQIGYSNNWIDQNVYNLILSVTLLSMVISPLIINSSDGIFIKLDKLLKRKIPNFYRKVSLNGITEVLSSDELSGHIVICGYGKVGKYVTKGIQKMNEDFVVIELNDTEIDKSTPNNFIIGDASNKDILLAAKIERAKACIVTMPTDSDINEIIRLCLEINPDIKIITRIHDKINEDNLDFIHSMVEPEYETASRMVETLSRIYNKRQKYFNLK